MASNKTDLSDLMPSLGGDLLDFDPDNPMGSPEADAAQTADPVAGAVAALDATLTGFAARAKAEESRFVQATDTEYWVCFCFETRAQKDEFLTALKLDGLGNKHVNGLEAAKRLGVEIKAKRAPWGAPRMTARLTEMAVEDDVLGQEPTGRP